MKRFTDTDKWRDAWFRKLTPGVKLAFLYIVDNCDAAGVWEGDTELAEFTIGMTIPWDKVKEAMGDRIRVLDSGKWWLTRFIEFQYGRLSEDCKPHQNVMRLLNAHELMNIPYGIPFPKGIQRVKEEEEEEDKEKEGGMQGGKSNGNHHPEFDEFWTAYPRKVGKGHAESAWKKHRCSALLPQILTAIRKAKISPDWTKDGGQFIPHPATWLNRKGWDDELSAPKTYMPGVGQSKVYMPGLTSRSDE